MLKTNVTNKTNKLINPSALIIIPAEDPALSTKACAPSILLLLMSSLPNISKLLLDELSVGEVQVNLVDPDGVVLDESLEGNWFPKEAPDNTFRSSLLSKFVFISW